MLACLLQRMAGLGQPQQGEVRDAEPRQVTSSTASGPCQCNVCRAGNRSVSKRRVCPKVTGPSPTRGLIRGAGWSFAAGYHLGEKTAGRASFSPPCTGPRILNVARHGGAVDWLEDS